MIRRLFLRRRHVDIDVYVFHYFHASYMMPPLLRDIIFFDTPPARRHDGVCQR